MTVLAASYPSTYIKVSAGVTVTIEGDGVIASFSGDEGKTFTPTEDTVYMIVSSNIYDNTCTLTATVAE